MLEWFKPKNKKNVVLPTGNLGPLQGVELIRAFCTEDEPKVKDFPKEKYSVYWENFLESVPGGYSVVVKFYSFKAGFISEHVITAQSLSEVRKEATKLILATMMANKVVS